MLQNQQQSITRPRHSHALSTTIIGEAIFKIMIEDKTKTNLLNTMMKIGGKDEPQKNSQNQLVQPSSNNNNQINTRDDGSQISSRQSMGGGIMDDSHDDTAEIEVTLSTAAEKKKKRRSFSNVIQQTTMNISKGISSLQFKSRGVALRVNELLVYTIKDSHQNRKLKANLHLTNASVTMDPLYKNCIKIETREKILRIMIEDESIRKGWFYSLNEQTKRKEEALIASHFSSSSFVGGDDDDGDTGGDSENCLNASMVVLQPTPLNSALNQISIVESMVSQFTNQINEMNPHEYFDPNSNLLAEPPTGRKRRVKFPSFEISGTTNDVLDSINPTPTTTTTTHTSCLVEPIVKEHLSMLTTEFSNLQHLTFASAIAHLTLIGHSVMESAQIEANPQTILNHMTGGSSILRQGYLIKAGPNDHQPWKKRYCVLTQSREFRYLEDFGGTLQGLFSVENANVSRIHMDASTHIIPFATTTQDNNGCVTRRFLFMIETIDGIVYKFEAPSYVSMKSWFQSFERCGCRTKLDDGVIWSGKLWKERLTTPMSTTTSTTTTTNVSNPMSTTTNVSTNTTCRTCATTTSGGDAISSGTTLHTSQWIPRHVVLLESNELKYYNKKGGTLVGTIKLEDSYVNRVTCAAVGGTNATTCNDQMHHCLFKIYTPERSHQFQAKDEETLQKWIQTILQYGCKLRNEMDPEPVFKKKLDQFYLNSTVMLEQQEKLQDYIVDEEMLKSKLLRNKSQASNTARMMNVRKAQPHDSSQYGEQRLKQEHSDEEVSNQKSEDDEPFQTIPSTNVEKVETLKRMNENHSQESMTSSPYRPPPSLHEEEQHDPVVGDRIHAPTKDLSKESKSSSSNDDDDDEVVVMIPTSFETIIIENRETVPNEIMTTSSFITTTTTTTTEEKEIPSFETTKDDDEKSSTHFELAMRNAESHLLESLSPNNNNNTSNDLTKSEDEEPTISTNHSSPHHTQRGCTEDTPLPSSSRTITTTQIALHSQSPPSSSSLQETKDVISKTQSVEPRQSKEFFITSFKAHCQEKVIGEAIQKTLQKEEQVSPQVTHSNEQYHHESNHDTHYYKVSNPSFSSAQPTFVYEVVQGLSPTIVIDHGSGVLKAGLADEEYPSAVFCNMIGRLKEYSIAKGMMMNVHHLHHHHYVGRRATTTTTTNPSQQLYFGDGAQALRSLLSLSYPVEKGIVKNFEDCEMMLQYTQDRLGLESFSDHPVLLTESPDNPRAKRERQTQMMFETFDVPYLYMAKSAVLALFAYGRTTGMCLDSGDGVSHVVPIYEGYSLPHAVNRLNLAGKDLTHYMIQLLNERQNSPFTQNGTSAFEIVKCLKEELCEVQQTSTTTLNPTVVNYELPDGSSVSVGEERFKCPELLFNPSLTGHHDSLGIVELCKKTIYDTDIDLRKTLAQNIFLSGGSTQFKGLQTRLQHDLQQVLPYSQKVRVSNSIHDSQQYLAWIGGSILGKMSRFTYDAMSREEYDEMGPHHAHVKFM
ncbi:hypothetical protein FDP41_000397 [Naegleria fowleri]|uniref:PH domain-containing protein n=1 Tax=Naegleria fowleri TaxID=5763 RepID=A0A6A5CGQ1_NAEFO|nr:uncharacterized protein FDP41_000397 [Naegleria fowleri]KAF0984498.1 hypothetical protein FDP41_000397 [Naegleria fowleri]